MAAPPHPLFELWLGGKKASAAMPMSIRAVTQSHPLFELCMYVCMYVCGASAQGLRGRIPSRTKLWLGVMVASSLPAASGLGVSFSSTNVEQKEDLQSLHGHQVVVGLDFVVASAPLADFNYTCTVFSEPAWTDDDGNVYPAINENLCAFKSWNQGQIWTHDRLQGWEPFPSSHQEDMQEADVYNDPVFSATGDPALGFGLALDGDLLAATAPGLSEDSDLSSSTGFKAAATFLFKRNRNCPKANLDSSTGRCSALATLTPSEAGATAGWGQFSRVPVPPAVYAANTVGPTPAVPLENGGATDPQYPFAITDGGAMDASFLKTWIAPVAMRNGWMAVGDPMMRCVGRGDCTCWGDDEIASYAGSAGRAAGLLTNYVTGSKTTCAGENLGGDRAHGVMRGAIYLYQKDEGGTDNWGPASTIVNSHGNTFDGSVTPSLPGVITGTCSGRANLVTNPYLLSKTDPAYQDVRADRQGTSGMGQTKQCDERMLGVSVAFNDDASVLVSGAADLAGNACGLEGGGCVFIFERDYKCGNSAAEDYGGGGSPGAYSATHKPGSSRDGTWSASDLDNKCQEDGSAANFWGQRTVVMASDRDKHELASFGKSVSITGTAVAGDEVLAVGAPGSDEGAKLMTFLPELNTACELDWFGDQVDPECVPWSTQKQTLPWSGDNKRVCDKQASMSNTCNSGKVYLYSRNHGGSNHWGQMKALSLPAASRRRGDSFGSSVSIDGDYLVVGAASGVPTMTPANVRPAAAARSSSSATAWSGAVFLYTRHMGGNNNWGLLAELKDARIAAVDMMGVSVSVNAEALVVSAGAPSFASDTAIRGVGKVAIWSVCPKGQYLNIEGSERKCAACPAGSYTQGAGSLSCEPCPEGMFGSESGCDSPNGGNKGCCKPCMTGQVTNKTGQGACTPCSGAFKANEKATSCEPCPEGEVGTGGSVCSPCAVGLVADIDGLCKKCPAGVSCVNGISSFLPGWWIHSDNASRINNDTVMYTCLVNEACVVNTSSNQLLCREGHESRLCGVCSWGYIMGAGLLCSKCPEGTAQDQEKGQELVTTMSFIGLLLLLLIGLAICHKARKMKDIVPEETAAISHPDRTHGEVEEARPLSSQAQAAKRFDLVEADEIPPESAFEEKQARPANRFARLRWRFLTVVLLRRNTTDRLHMWMQFLSLMDEHKLSRTEKLSLLDKLLKEDSSGGFAHRFGENVNAARTVAFSGEIAEASHSASKGAKRPEANNKEGDGDVEGGGFGGCLANLKSVLGDKLKILIAFCQISNTFTMNLDIVIPDELAKVYQAFSAINIDLNSLTGIACQVPTTYYDQFYSTMAGPIVFSTFIFLVVCVGLVCVKTQKGKAWLSNTLLKVWSMALFLIFPNVCSTLMRIFKCINIDGERFLEADLRLSCDAPTHTLPAFVGVICFALYPIGIPAVFISLLYRSKVWLPSKESYQKQQGSDTDDPELGEGVLWRNPNISVSMGWLFGAYEPQYWFWEILEFTRKFLLSSVIIFVKPGSSVQILCALVICVVFLCANSLTQPYDRDGDDVMQFTALLCLVLTLILGLALRMAEFESFSVWETLLFSYILVFVNVFIFAMGAYLLGTDLLIKLKKIEAKIKPKKTAELMPISAVNDESTSVVSVGITGDTKNIYESDSDGEFGSLVAPNDVHLHNDASSYVDSDSSSDPGGDSHV